MEQKYESSCQNCGIDFDYEPDIDEDGEELCSDCAKKLGYAD